MEDGTHVIVYDCSASGMLGGNFFSLYLPAGYSLIGINVAGDRLQSPTGCRATSDSPSFFSFEHAGSNDAGFCFGHGGARFEEGHLFRAILERELGEDGNCG